MKKNIFIALAALVICSSCNDNYYLSETEQDLAQLSSEYDDAKLNEEEDEGEKIETLASEDEIKASMDEYKTMLMNRASVAKERVTRTAYATTTNVVGVFKINSCGSYKELKISMDCEDKRDNSHITGNVGASYIENGNVNMVFCLTDASRYYPGGVLLVDNINYNRTYVYNDFGRRVDLDVFVRHHDTEDNNPSNSVFSDNGDYDHKTKIKGYSKIDDDVTLAWAFPRYLTQMEFGTYYGARGINYGLLTPANTATGTIYCDDEDSRNKNWIQRYLNGTTLDNGFNDSTALREYGVTANENTTYSVCLSTDTKFSKNNIYHAPILQW